MTVCLCVCVRAKHFLIPGRQLPTFVTPLGVSSRPQRYPLASVCDAATFLTRGQREKRRFVKFRLRFGYVWVLHRNRVCDPATRPRSVALIVSYRCRWVYSGSSLKPDTSHADSRSVASASG